MRKKALSFVLLLSLLQCVKATLWPQPQSLNLGSATVNVDPTSFQFISAINSEILNSAFQRYNQLIFYAQNQSAPPNANLLQSLNVLVNSSNESLQFGTDESYSLNVQAPVATLKANTIFGAIRGLETFSQLVQYDSVKGYTFQFTPIEIVDYPRFPHRGLLIDSSRHYLPVASILRTIDAMSFSKMNVLHWHIVDAESFPLESKSFPKLSQGAWRQDLVYSQDDISTIVNYGIHRGVRVIPELDTPGHTASWGIGYPELVAKCSDYAKNVNNIPLDPTNPFTYQVLSGLFGEVSGLFEDQMVHIGGDEVVYGCWQEDSNITQWMQKNGVKNLDQLMTIYMTQLWNILQLNQKKIIAWEEVFDSYGLNLPNHIIIEVWKDEKTLLSVAQSKLQGILAYGWYLDHLDQTWQNFYTQEPFSSPDWTLATEKWIIGGEAAAWGEKINPFNIDQVVWPRTAATAERLWSDRGTIDTGAAQPRLIEHICRLNRRGIASAPISPGYC